MSAIKSNPAAKTVGIAPKVAWPTIGLILLGVVLLLLDQFGAVDVDDSVWVTLLGSAAGVAGVGGAAPPALQSAKDGGGTTHASTHRR